MELTWHDVYEDAVTRFDGQTPGAKLEAQIVEVFELRPAAVLAAVTKLADRFDAGKVRSPWPLVARELEESPDRRQVVATGAQERAQAVRLAEARITNVGYALTSEHEVLAELFAPPELTADRETLAALELPAGQLGAALGRARDAALARLDARGREEIPGTGGLLARYDSPELRARMLELWRRTRTPDIDWPKPPV